MNYGNYTLSASNLLRRVYGWMTAGLVVTGVVAYATFASNLSLTLFHNPLLVMLLVLLQFGCVIFLSAKATEMDTATAAITFILYSALTGLTLSSIFLVYQIASIYSTFFICAGTFGAMAAYGYFTKADLSALGSFLFMALIGLIIASLVNLFVQSAQGQLIISAFGVLVFTLLTAYDVQMIKRLGYELEGRGIPNTNVAIVCALKLYLDFINLFLYLLQMLGSRNQRNS